MSLAFKIWATVELALFLLGAAAWLIAYILSDNCHDRASDVFGYIGMAFHGIMSVVFFGTVAYLIIAYIFMLIWRA